MLLSVRQPISVFKRFHNPIRKKVQISLVSKLFKTISQTTMKDGEGKQILPRVSLGLNIRLAKLLDEEMHLHGYLCI